MNVFGLKFDKLKSKKDRSIFLYLGMEDLHVKISNGHGVFSVKGDPEKYHVYCHNEASPEYVLRSLCQCYRQLAMKSSGFRNLRKRILNES